MLWICVSYSCFFGRICLALIQINCLHSLCLLANQSARSCESISGIPPSPTLSCVAIGSPVERELDSERLYQHAELCAIEQPSNTPRLVHKTRLPRCMRVGGRRMSRAWEGTKRAPFAPAACVCGRKALRAQHELNSGAPPRCCFNEAFVSEERGS